MALRKLGELGNYEDIDRLLKLFSLNDEIENTINAIKKIIMFVSAVAAASYIFFPWDSRGLFWCIIFIALLACYFIFQKKKQYKIFSEADDICMTRYGDTYLNSLLELNEDIKACLEEKTKAP